MRGGEDMFVVLKRRAGGLLDSLKLMLVEEE